VTGGQIELLLYGVARYNGLALDLSNRLFGLIWTVS